MEGYKIGGKTFHGISQALTANQNDYILAKLRLAGCIEVLSDIDEKRTPEQRATDLLTRILDSGFAPYLLAGCLTEDGKKWSRESANKNAEMFGEITDVDEQVLMRTSIVDFVAGFFSSGGPFSLTSQKSSNPSERVPLTKNAARATSGTSRR